jgi:hypothetical protein
LTAGTAKSKSLDHDGHGEKAEGEGKTPSFSQIPVIPANAGIQRVDSGAKRRKNPPPPEEGVALKA